ncbi:Hypothetical protein NTJ_01294 [Nesidiocoris tenuis]|uniref:ATP-dependent helicase C-terminal domain-containing protein n=1 Tax=Nesidiocoris tenuis TaxID=355587 RepID=A0ABN7A931_9HEMI|nr:Hypothetical protein NTJ_01294 [Nesidiocoris tenuis]
MRELAASWTEKEDRSGVGWGWLGGSVDYMTEIKEGLDVTPPAPTRVLLFGTPFPLHAEPFQPFAGNQPRQRTLTCSRIADTPNRVQERKRLVQTLATFRV